jgi:hypothetical protein
MEETRGQSHSLCYLGIKVPFHELTVSYRSVPAICGRPGFLDQTHEKRHLDASPGQTQHLVSFTGVGTALQPKYHGLCEQG